MMKQIRYEFEQGETYRIEGYHGYYAEDGRLYSVKRGKVVQIGYGKYRGGQVILSNDNGRNYHTLGKVFFAALNGISPDSLPRNIMYRWDGHWVSVRTYAEWRRGVILKHTGSKENIRQDYLVVARFAKLALQVMDGDNAARIRLHKWLHGCEKELLAYARYYVGQSTAKSMVEDTMDLVFKKVTEGKLFIASPLGYMKTAIRGMIADRKKHFTSAYNEGLTEKYIAEYIS